MNASKLGWEGDGAQSISWSVDRTWGKQLVSVGRKTLALLLLRPRGLSGGDKEPRDGTSMWSSSETYGRMLGWWKLVVPELVDIDSEHHCSATSASILSLGMETRVCGGASAGFVAVVVVGGVGTEGEREVSLSMHRGL